MSESTNVPTASFDVNSRRSWIHERLCDKAQDQQPAAASPRRGSRDDLCNKLDFCLFVYGPEYEPDPLRRMHLRQGGHF
jgi:hypothetical protein